MTATAFQDLIPRNHCWGCGPANEGGLQLKSFWDGERSVASFRPRPEHSAGPPHVLNGGILCTITDCHAICTAIADAYRREGRRIGQGEFIWYVTGSLEVRYLEPTPIDSPVHLVGHIDRVEGRKTWVSVEVSSGGRTTSRGLVLAVRVDPERFGLRETR